MLDLSPKTIILIGLVLVLLGVIIPFLMIMQFIPSTFFLNFFAAAASILGVFLGIIGASQIIRKNRE